jgi:hypothetical protein
MHRMGPDDLRKTPDGTGPSAVAPISAEHAVSAPASCPTNRLYGLPSSILLPGRK